MLRVDLFTTMTFQATFFVILLCSQRVLALDIRFGVLHRELGARPDFPVPSPLTAFPTPTIPTTLFPTYKPSTSHKSSRNPTLSPNGSYGPSTHPSSVTGSPEASLEPTTPNPSLQPTITPAMPSPSLPPVTIEIPTSDQVPESSVAPANGSNPAISSPSLPPVTIEIPTTNQVPESGVAPTDGSNPAVGVNSVKSRNGSQNVISAAAISGLVLGVGGLCIMGVVSSLRRGRKDQPEELKGSTPDEPSL